MSQSGSLGPLNAVGYDRSMLTTEIDIAVSSWQIELEATFLFCFLAVVVYFLSDVSFASSVQFINNNFEVCVEVKVFLLKQKEKLSQAKRDKLSVESPLRLFPLGKQLFRDCGESRRRTLEYCFTRCFN